MCLRSGKALLMPVCEVLHMTEEVTDVLCVCHVTPRVPMWTLCSSMCEDTFLSNALFEGSILHVCPLVLLLEYFKDEGECGLLVEICWWENRSNLRKTSRVVTLSATVSCELTRDRTPAYGDTPATNPLNHALKPDVHLNQWFPKCASRIPRDRQPFRRGSVATFM